MRQFFCVFILAAMVFIFLPCIVSQWNNVAAGVSSLAKAHAQALAKPKDAVLTYVLGFFVNGSVAFLLLLGVVAIVNDPEYSNASVPFVLLANNSEHPAVMSTMISVLIVLGSVTTAVNMTSAMTVRICHSLDKNYAFDGKPDKKAMLTILLLTSISFLVARFGLLPVIQKGYSIEAYIALPSICVPYRCNLNSTFICSIL